MRMRWSAVIAFTLYLAGVVCTYPFVPNRLVIHVDSVGNARFGDKSPPAASTGATLPSWPIFRSPTICFRSPFRIFPGPVSPVVGTSLDFTPVH